jgi:hypothetical protein
MSNASAKLHAEFGTFCVFILLSWPIICALYRHFFFNLALHDDSLLNLRYACFFSAVFFCLHSHVQITRLVLGGSSAYRRTGWTNPRWAGTITRGSRNMSHRKVGRGCTAAHLSSRGHFVNFLGAPMNL